MKVFLTRDYLQFIGDRCERAADLCASMPANIHAEHAHGRMIGIMGEAHALAAAMEVAADHECAPVYAELRRRLVTIDRVSLDLLADVERQAGFDTAE